MGRRIAGELAKNGLRLPARTRGRADTRTHGPTDPRTHGPTARPTARPTATPTTTIPLEARAAPCGEPRANSLGSAPGRLRLAWPRVRALRPLRHWRQPTAALRGLPQRLLLQQGAAGPAREASGGAPGQSSGRCKQVSNKQHNINSPQAVSTPRAPSHTARPVFIPTRSLGGRGLRSSEFLFLRGELGVFPLREGSPLVV